MPLSLLDADIPDLRKIYLRDFWDESAVTWYSHYNRANKKQFLENADLKAIGDAVYRLWWKELDGVYVQSNTEQLANGADATAAAAAATLLQKDAFFRLIRSEVRKRMMEDPGYRASIADETTRKEIFNAWASEIAEDRTFTKQTTTSNYRGIPIRIR